MLCRGICWIKQRLWVCIAGSKFKNPFNFRGLWKVKYGVVPIVGRTDFLSCDFPGNNIFICSILNGRGKYGGCSLVAERTVVETRKIRVARVRFSPSAFVHKKG